MAISDSELNLNGWGYKDSLLYLSDRKKKEVQFNGSRYKVLTGVMPGFAPWLEEHVGVDYNNTPPLKCFEDHVIPLPKENQRVVECLTNANIDYTTDGQTRLIRAHGQNLADMVRLRMGSFERIPDIVIFPKSEKDVVTVIEAANNFGACIIPAGGRTNVTNALDCLVTEERMIISLDMTRMNKVKWINAENMTARAEAGIIGQELQRQLREKGFTLGHEPDSLEFSSLGGWIATRASGMKRNAYGNIEDMVQQITMVTPRGILQKSSEAPRVSAGPDIHHVILGSEGSFGVITEATIKIRPIPECVRYQNIIFPDFESGVMFARHIAREKRQCAAFRLIDAVHFSLALALRPPLTLLDRFKIFLLTHVKGFNLDTVSVATLIFEGTKAKVDRDEKDYNDLCKKYGGIMAGSKGCERAYAMTFAAAYMRDFGLEVTAFGESFETSVPWDKVLPLWKNVKGVIGSEFQRLGIKPPCLITCRWVESAMHLTQLYDSGVCLYFYCAFNRTKSKTPFHDYEQIEEAARKAMLACGGSISHHHGVGKLRAGFMRDTIGDLGLSLLRAIKQELDPNNVFACGNLFTVSKI